jgi:DNA polymerase-3 subunit delta'
MAFADFPEQQQVIELLQRSLERRRLAHAYLFNGESLDDLEAMARTLAKTLNCEQPMRRNSVAIDSCDRCLSCRKIDGSIHADIQWVRPESKTRIIGVDQMRDLMRSVQLTPIEAAWKVGIIVAADRLKTEAANAFLKTLEEPPQRSILILLTTDRERLLETIISRCLRLTFAGDGQRTAALYADWLEGFAAAALAEQKGLLGRYRILDVLLKRLGEMREQIEKDLSARSPAEQYPDAEPELLEKWEDELKAAIESEYRRQRTDLLAAVQLWLRDVWLMSLGQPDHAAALPSLAPSARQVAERLSPREALGNLRALEQTQKILFTNVQESLALEVGLLKLKL